MTRRVWFCYEEGPACQPMPVLYYDELPIKSGPTNIGKRRILQSQEIPEDYAEMSFHSLQALYPYLSEQETLQSTTPVVKSEEQQMTRPVEGFMTKQGKFFESENEANFYEAAYALNKAAATGVVALGVSGEENVEEAVKAIINFISVNRELVTEYIHTRRTLEDERTRDAMDGQPAFDNSADDPSIRSESDIQMDETPSTETQSQTTGEPPEQPPIPE